jgi:GntR family transcriptional regulator, carbon starvation induced regulator
VLFYAHNQTTTRKSKCRNGLEVAREGDVGPPSHFRDDVTLAEEAYRRLRHDIISGVFDAGTPLRLEPLRERYGLSFSPLREALNRLYAERLVVSSALKGFRVGAFSIDEMRDSIRTRVLVDVDALRQSIQRGTDDWEAAIIGAFHALSRCAARVHALPEKSATKLEELETRHRDFHFALISHCGSQWLIRFSAQLYAQTERYRRPLIGGPPMPDVPPRDIEAEHRAIMDAAISREEDEAARLLAAHYWRTGEVIELKLKAMATSAPTSDRSRAKFV